MATTTAELESVDLSYVKAEPWSEGIKTPRKKIPKELAVINEACTGCAGSPVCVTYCPGGRVHVLGAGRRSPAFRHN